MGKRNKATKLVSIFMSVVLIVGLMPLPAYAGEAEEKPESTPLTAGSSDLLGSDGALTTSSSETVSYIERSWDGSKVVSETKSREAATVPGDGAMTTGWYYLNQNVTKKGRISLSGDVSLILGDNCTLDVKGLYIPKGSTLTIYGQENGTGKIYSHPSDGTAIGAYKNHKGGAVVIHGGRIVAEGADNCAAIGGNDDDRKDVGPITIYGGKVNATGGNSGAGLGGGRACEGGTICIYGGEVTAQGGHYGSGIGGGNGQDTDPLRGAHAGTIKIYGGKVNATGGDDGAGIGGGEGGNAGSILINGGEVTAQGGNNSAGIGCGEGESTGVGGNVTINDGTVIAYGGEDAAGIGGGDESHCDTVTINGGNVTATGGKWGAGIGAGRDTDGGTIKITGGTVKATGKCSSAGIGGGDASGSYADYSNITITGGNITAQGDSQGAGIGGGENGHATVSITGGIVDAKSGPDGGSGIGNGKDGKGSALILGWTEATKDSISIKASSYSGLVRLNQPFKNAENGRFKQTEAVADLGALAANPPLTAWDPEEETTSTVASSWAELQEAISQAEVARTITLTNSITAGASEECIQIFDGKNITIDLNGKTMNRGLGSSACVDKGSVIQVAPNATLTIIDSSGNSGTITGGASIKGGGICNYGTLYFKGGTISANKAANSSDGAGGGIFSSDGAQLYIAGGIIQNNEAYNGGGVYVGNASTAELSSVSITENTAHNKGGGLYDDTPSLTIKGNLNVTNNTGENLHLCDGRLLTVTGPLAPTTRIGVTMDTPSGNITSGLKNNGDASNFLSDASIYTPRIDGAGEAYLFKAADYQVNSWDDLQAKVNSASEGQIIQLTGDVINTQGRDRIKVSNKKITIDLNGNTVDRRRTSSDTDGHVFELLDGTVLTIRDSAGGGTITGGYATNGGAINISTNSTLVFTGGAVTGNKAKDGGGIYVKGALVMTGGSVVNNNASRHGGGIYVTDDGRINLTGADISHNYASDDGGGINAKLKANSTINRCTIAFNRSDDCGAGIFLDASGKTLTITNSSIDNNSSGDDGGGIYLENGTIAMKGGSLSSNYSDNDSGGAKVTKNTTFTATDTTINGNTARDEEGGGVKNYGVTHLTNCMISNNKSKKQGGGVYNNDSDDSKGNLTLENCTIIGNSSSDNNGGGVYSDYSLTLIGGEITGNYSASRGGGIFIGDDSKDTSIRGRIIVKDNTAAAENGPDVYLRTHKLVLTGQLLNETQIGISKENDGNLGIFTDGYSTYNGTDAPSDYFFSPEGLEVIPENGEASLASSWKELRQELANATSGATFSLTHNYTASSKDDYLEIPENTEVTIDLCGYTLNRNRASADGDGHVIWVKEGARLTLTDSTAPNGKPGNGTITGGYSKRGGGIYVDDGATCTISSVQIKNNRASDDGAGLYVKGSLIATNCTLAFNTADDCGGGIFSDHSGHIDLTNVEVNNNLAKGDDGGGLHLFLGNNSRIHNSKISYNQAGDTGGGIYMSAKDQTLTITDTEIDSNRSKDDGGGFFLDNGIVEMTNGSISKNESSNDSGGIKVTSSTGFKATNVTISENKAGSEEGGGLKNYGTTDLENCTINKNTAEKEGGGIFNDNDEDSVGTVTLTNCELSNNSSSDRGGGIYSDHKLVIKGGDNAKITGNSASHQGNGIYIAKDAEFTRIKGAIIATDNNGEDIYLRKGQVLTINGTIEGTSIGVINMESIGVFTQGYGEQHPSANPANEPSNFFGKDPSAIKAEWTNDKTEAKLVSNWPDLQRLIDEAARAGADGNHVVTLDKNYTAGSSDDHLMVRKQSGSFDRNGEVTIDLNGYTLNRNLTSKEDEGNVIEVYEGAHLTIKDSASAAGETDDDGNPIMGTITGGYTSKGGGIYVNEDAVLDFQGGGIAGNHATDNGGGIYNGGTLRATGGYLSFNAADDHGAGIYSTEDGNLTIENVTIMGNIAGDDGGGLYIKSGGSITNCSISSNSAGNCGAAFRIDAKGKTLTIIDTTIESNCSVDDGGGIYLHNGTINMTGGSISKNATANDSGAVKVTEKTTFNATNVIIKQNRANKEEAGALKNFGTTTLTNCEISGNRASKEGGALFNDGTMTLDNCTITENESEKCGGGVYSDEKLNIIGGTITNNTSADFGGGVYLDDDSDATGIRGNLVIADNNAANFGNDLYLCSGRKLAVTGALESTQSESAQPLPAQIHVDLEKGTGVLTNNYKAHNQTAAGEAKDPSTYFIAARGYDLFINGDNEVEISSDWPALKRRIENAESGTTIKLDKDYAATPSDDRILIKNDKNITIDLAGHTLNRNRKDETDDGHVLEIKGGSTLTVMDSSTEKTGTIMGGWSERGGGIYINEHATLNLQGGTIANNRTDTNGGGIYVRGVMNFTGGKVCNNKTDGSGGGIYLTETGTLNLEGGTVTGNNAAEQGGGIQVSSIQTKVSVKGAPVVFGNRATESGTDICLPSQGILTVTGQLTESAKLGIALTGHRGVPVKFTQGYGQANGGEDPAEYFISTEGYTVYAEGNEAVAGRKVYGESEYTSPFVSANNQINTTVDTLSNQNWMSGISGERYLNEINTPRAHDSGMNNVDEKYDATAQMALKIWSVATIALSLISGTFFVVAPIVATINLAIPTDWTSLAAAVADGRAADLAKTQNEYINQQLEHGVRHLDIRLNNQKKVYKFIGDGVFNGYTWSDNGEDLWICHGKAGGGTYQAQDPDGEYLSFNQVLDWTMEFLEAHPTETIVIDLSPETENKDQHRTIYERARKILEDKALQINPSTGEPYLYKEPISDDYFAKYTNPPKLADCRGKIVIKAGGSEDFIDYVGGWDYAATGITKTGIGTYTNTPQELVDELTQFALDHSDPIPLPTDADTHLDITWSWGLNSTAQSMGNVSYIFSADPPWKNAQYVNSHIVGDGKLLGSDKTGQFMGIVSMDGYAAEYGEQVWRTNFFDELQYCTVTVKSGLKDPLDPSQTNPNYPDQTFKILKGTNLTIPDNIYKQLGGDTFFGGWQALTDSGESTTCKPNDTFKVDEDVTFTAQWLTEGQVPVRVVWKDGNNADSLRPENLNVNVQNGSGSSTPLTLKESEGWSGIITQSGDEEVTLTPDWNKIDSGEYSYAVSLVPGTGYTLTLIHTPVDRAVASGTIVWNDDDDAARKRPAFVTLKLFKGDTEISEKQVSAADSWHYAFDPQPLYENGEKLTYRVSQNTVDSYSTTVDGYSFINTYVPAGQETDPDATKLVQGVVQWNDSGDAYSKRPASVEVTLKANEVEIATQKATESSIGLWAWSFGVLPEKDAEGNDIAYSITAQDVAGYDVAYDQITYENPADSSDPSVVAQADGSGLFVITYTLQVAEESKTEATVLSTPNSMELTYNAKEQPLIKGGEAEGGTMMYALSNDALTQPSEEDFSASVPSATDAGSYHIWYYVIGDVLHTNSAYTYVQATINKAEQTIKAENVEGVIGDEGIAVTASVTGVNDKTEGLGTLSFEVVEGADIVSVDAETGALTLLKAGTATVKVTAAETQNYAEMSRLITVTSHNGGDDPQPPTPSATISISFNANGGTGEMPSVTISSGSTIKLPANSFTREGYEFAGWNTKADGTGVSYKDGQEISPSALGLSSQAESSNLLMSQSADDPSDAELETAAETVTFNLYAQWKEQGSSATNDASSDSAVNDPQSEGGANNSLDAHEASSKQTTQPTPNAGDALSGQLAVLLATLFLASLLLAVCAAKLRSRSRRE